MSMPDDPKGFYARLGVPPTAAPEVISAAYRRQARQVHPDVPDTGDAAAFMALKQAYDVLIQPETRQAYDQAARDAEEAEPEEINPSPFRPMASPPIRHPRLHDLPTVVWAGLAALLAVGVIEVGLHLSAPAPKPSAAPIPATARDVPPRDPAEPAEAAYGPPPIRLAGVPNFYIAPAATAAMLWRSGDSGQLEPWGRLAAFSAVQGLRLIRSTGMVEVKVTDEANGFVEAGRLTPGDAPAAARAWCTYNAGPLPANGEILTHAASHGDAAAASLTIENQTGEPVVVKLRGTSGGIAASVFLTPGGEAHADALPAQPVSVDFATGEVWSRACHVFTAGMRARRLPGSITLGTATRLIIPPERDVPGAELSDQAFARE